MSGLILKASRNLLAISAVEYPSYSGEESAPYCKEAFSKGTVTLTVAFHIAADGLESFWELSGLDLFWEWLFSLGMRDQLSPHVSRKN